MCSTNIITYFLGKLGVPSLPFDERSESKCFYISYSYISYILIQCILIYEVYISIELYNNRYIYTKYIIYIYYSKSFYKCNSKYPHKTTSYYYLLNN